jgi:hypothetical protein
LALTVVSDQQIRIRSTSSKTSTTQHLDGYAVQLRIKTTDLSDNQRWIFTTDGFIVCKAYSDLALTSLATVIPEDNEKIVVHGIRMNDDDPLIFFLAVCPQCSAKSPFINRQR